MRMYPVVYAPALPLRSAARLGDDSPSGTASGISIPPAVLLVGGGFLLILLAYNVGSFRSRPRKPRQRKKRVSQPIIVGKGIGTLAAIGIGAAGFAIGRATA